MKLLPFVLFLAAATAHSAPQTINTANEFFRWLEEHAQEFAICEPVQEGDVYVLCDKTHVPKTELRRLFALKPKALLAEMAAKDLRVELVCSPPGTPRVLGEACTITSSNKMFAEITALHGKFVPSENKIYVRNSASPGSVIHEFIHSLQSANENKIYGKAYKKERNAIQREFVAWMDKEIAVVKGVENAGNPTDLKKHLQDFMLVSEMMRRFAPWQDLIDERGIFQLYIKYGKDFGATPEDVELARKNMGFICKNPKIGPLLPKTQCG